MVIVFRMGSLTIELPPHQEQTVVNLCRWAELLDNREHARYEGRVETDRHGHVVLGAIPPVWHGMYEAEVGILLHSQMRSGTVMTVCPISTADGVKTADVAWTSPERMQELGDGVCFRRAPEICVEILSPGNTPAEVREKTALYFDAGANEVWHCSISGAMTFLAAGQTEPLRVSRLCPECPAQIELR